jgi:hypothetical protein
MKATVFLQSPLDQVLAYLYDVSSGVPLIIPHKQADGLPALLIGAAKPKQLNFWIVLPDDLGNWTVIGFRQSSLRHGL